MQPHLKPKKNQKANNFYNALYSKIPLQLQRDFF